MDWSLFEPDEEDDPETREDRSSRCKEATKFLDRSLIGGYHIIEKGGSVEEAMYQFNHMNRNIPDLEVGETDTEVREISWCMLNEFKQPGWNEEQWKKILERNPDLADE